MKVMSEQGIHERVNSAGLLLVVLAGHSAVCSFSRRRGQDSEFLDSF